MSELVEHITDARNNGTINVYAVRYNQREKTDNVAVALPGNLNFDFRHDFCENIIQYLVYNNQTYYLCAKQGNSSDKLLQGKCVFMTHQDELIKANPDEVFLVSSYVGFVVDPVEEKVLIFDKKPFRLCLSMTTIKMRTSRERYQC